MKDLNMTREGGTLKILRKYKNMTQKQFSEYLEIPLITLAQWECGKRTPPLYLVKLIQFKVFNDTNQISIYEVIK